MLWTKYVKNANLILHIGLLGEKSKSWQKILGNVYQERKPKNQQACFHLFFYMEWGKISYHKVSQRFSPRYSLTISRKITEEKVLQKDSLSCIFILCFNFAVCYDRISFQGVGRHIGVTFSSWFLSSRTQSKKDMNIFKIYLLLLIFVSFIVTSHRRL